MRAKMIGNIDFVIRQWLQQDTAFAGTNYVRASGRYFTNGSSGHTGRRMFFQGDTIYSYHDRFPIARILSDGAVLFTTKEYSRCTEQHKQAVWWACRKKQFFRVENPALEPEADTLEAKYRELFAKVMSRRERMLSMVGVLYDLRKEYRALCQYFGLPIAYEPSKEQWRAFALRYKKYYTLINVTRPLAGRLNGRGNI